MKLLSVVFSFRNEENNLADLVNRVSKAISNLNDWNYELIFVNDYSKDNSEKKLIELQKTHPIKIINMSRRFGTNHCVLAGFNNCSGDCIIYMDSDLQDPPEIIPKLIEKYEEGFEVVHTIRIKRLGESKIKLFMTSIAYKIINYFSSISLPINAGDFKLISRVAMNNLLDQKDYNPYIRGLSVWIGFKQGYVEYIREPRGAGKTKFPIFFSINPIEEFIRGITSHSLVPLYIGMVLGLITTFFSIVLICYAFISKLKGIAVPGTTSIIITISFFSGTILFTLGLIGIYIARIHEQTRGRTKYIIKNIIDYKKK